MTAMREIHDVTGKSWEMWRREPDGMMALVASGNTYWGVSYAGVPVPLCLALKHVQGTEDHLVGFLPRGTKAQSPEMTVCPN